MLGDLLTRGLVLVLGYAYPAFQCFKTVEKNKVEIDELRFWCQYWIIVALVTVFERIVDLFISSWLPMYGEMKLGLIIYLWYPRTKGTGYVYETFLRPYVAAHETDIDRKVEELRARMWDLAVYYWQNCTDLGQTAFFQVLEYLASQSAKFTNPKSQEQQQQQLRDDEQPAARDGKSSLSIFGRSRKKKASTPPESSTTPIFEAPNLRPIKTPHNIHPHHPSVSDLVGASPPNPSTPTTPIEEALHSARLRLRRSKPGPH